METLWKYNLATERQIKSVFWVFNIAKDFADDVAPSVLFSYITGRASFQIGGVFFGCWN